MNVNDHDLQVWAAAMSQAARPARWRLIQYRRWRRRFQPVHMVEFLREALTVEVEALRQFGVDG